MRKAILLLDRRRVLRDGAVLQVKIWFLPRPVPPSRHLYKYSLFFGWHGRRIVGYDNERGKGDHRHYGDREEAYMFRSLEELLLDFEADVQRAQKDLS